MDPKAIVRKPSWIRGTIPSGEKWRRIENLIAQRGLHTVCDEARCPNKAECWGCGTATFMILGELCTRNCRFCAVASAKEGRPVRQEEAKDLAELIQELGLRYAVLTSVDRDDLADKGAGHFAFCVNTIKGLNPGVLVEVLIPDYGPGELNCVLASSPDTVAHNLETVRRLQYVRDPRATADKSLATLEFAKKAGAPLTKSSLMLGLGETKEEVLSTMDKLRAVDVDVLVLGQYLQPTKAQLPVKEYLHPDIFADYAEEGKKRGFSSVIASPFARTSYHALQVWEDSKAGGL